MRTFPHKLAASACWFPSTGPRTNSNAIAAMVKVINVTVVFEFADV
jgi:hypothetical protein